MKVFNLLCYFGIHKWIRYQSPTVFYRHCDRCFKEQVGSPKLTRKGKELWLKIN